MSTPPTTGATRSKAGDHPPRGTPRGEGAISQPMTAGPTGGSFRHVRPAGSPGSHYREHGSGRRSAHGPRADLHARLPFALARARHPVDRSELIIARDNGADPRSCLVGIVHRWPKRFDQGADRARIDPFFTALASHQRGASKISEAAQLDWRTRLVWPPSEARQSLG